MTRRAWSATQHIKINHRQGKPVKEKGGEIAPTAEVRLDLTAGIKQVK